MSKPNQDPWTPIPDTYRERLDPTATPGQPLQVAKVNLTTGTITFVGEAPVRKRRGRTFHL